jgi:gliding motility-associated-like protein
VIGVNNFYATETNAGCEGPAAVVSLTLNANLTASINYNGNIFCQSSGNITPVISGTLGGSFSSIPSGLVINTSSGEIDLLQSSPSLYQVIYNPNSICGIPDTFQIEILPQLNGGFVYSSTFFCNSDNDPTAQLASGASYGTFTANPPTLVFANVNNGTIDLTATPPGIYTITNTIPANAFCPGYIGSFTLTITAAPIATIDYGSEIFCSGSNQILGVVVAGNTGGVFSSNPSGLDLNSISGNINLSSSPSGNYIVTYTIPGGGGCNSFSFSENINILASPVVTVSPTQTIKEGSSVEINAEGIGSFLWNNGDTLQKILVSPLETSLFCVTLSNNGCVDTACTKVIVELECGEIFIPSGFSPNGDGNNDNFKVRMNTKCLSSSLLRIYDRWGGLLFESPEINAGWDGTFKGELLANGVYTFTFEYKLLDSDFSEVKNGTVQLVR